VLEWRNIKTIISQAADRSSGKYKAFTLKKKMKIWDDEIKLIVQQKNLAHKKYLRTKTTDNETEYKRRGATAKTESGKDITDPENNLYHTWNLKYTK
jgi:hypothetical protein